MWKETPLKASVRPNTSATITPADSQGIAIVTKKESDRDVEKTNQPTGLTGMVANVYLQQVRYISDFNKQYFLAI